MKKTVLYSLAFPNDRLYIRCLVYGIYILEVVHSALLTEIGFRIFVTSLGDLRVLNQVETTWLTATLTAIGELSCKGHEQLTSNMQPRYIFCPGILCASDPHFGTIKESHRSNYCCKFWKSVLHLNTVKILHDIQLSCIQLGGGIAASVYTERGKYYTLLGGAVAKMMAFEWGIMAVWQLRKFVPNYLMTSLADVDHWERSLRYHYCRVHDLLCEFPKFLPPGSGEHSNLISYLRWQLSRYDSTIKETKILVKKVILLTIETGSLTGM